MFEKLLDLLVSLWDRVSPCFIVHVYQHAGVLRLGKYHRTCAPGLHWKIPIVEEAFEVTTTVTTMRLPAQTITTSDARIVVASAIIKYSIRDVEPYISQITDQHDVLGDVTLGAIRAAVHEMSHEQLVTEPPEKRVLELVRRQVNDYGFKVHAITFVDLAQIRSYRFIFGAQPTSLDN